MRASVTALTVMFAGVAGAAHAVVLLTQISVATPSVDLSSIALGEGLADGWRFHDERFVDNGSTDDWHPDTPSLRGFRDPDYAGIIGFGTGELPQLTWVESIREIRLPATRPDRLLLDAAALGAFDTASAQNFSRNSVTVNGLTMKFAGQIGESGSSY